MAQSRTEKGISQKRRDTASGQFLVPLLHDLLKSPLDIETEEDAKFVHALAMKQVERNHARVNGDGVFSPSGLASCLRRVYLSKNWKKLGIERVSLPAIEPHFYFFTGNFLHLKWQYALYKLSAHPAWTLIDVEVPVISKRKDHGGTIDVLGLLDFNWLRENGFVVPKSLGVELVIVDVKGLNVRNWQKLDQGDIPHDYRIQVADYGMLFNSASQNGGVKPSKEMVKHFFPDGKFPKIKRAILLSENKGGPDYRHPAALTEQTVRVKDNLPDVRARLEALRTHEEEKTIPEIECESTKGIQFQGCPFSAHCKEEVKKVERKRAKDRNTKQYRVATPKRSNRSRRPRPK